VAFTDAHRMHLWRDGDVSAPLQQVVGRDEYLQLKSTG